MRIGQEAHVEDEIGVSGYPVAVPETDHGDQHGALLGTLEALRYEVPEFVDVEFGGVDDHVG
jgi:hypothetical protein